MRALIGFDGSEGAHDAVELARWLLAAEDEGEALLVNVLPHPGALPMAYYILGYEESPWESQFFSGAAEALAPASVSWASYVGGSPAHILTNIAEDSEFDLIVLGSPHRGAVGRALLGSVAQGVLHGSPIPVVVAPHGYAGKRHGPPHRIAVAYDGSAEAEMALGTATAMARKSGALTELITVTTAFPPSPGLAGFRMDDPRMTPEQVLAQGREAAGDEVPLRARELYEVSVAAGLAEGSDNADLIVIGSRSYGFLARVMVGSVSTELIHSASCPVLVVPRADSKARSRADEAPAQLERRRWTPSGAV